MKNKQKASTRSELVRIHRDCTNMGEREVTSGKRVKALSTFYVRI